LAALFRLSHHCVWRGLHFALLCVARDLGWCDYDYPLCGGHTLDDTHTPPVLGAPASIIGSVFPPTRLRPFVVDRNIWHFLWYGVVAGDGLRSVGEEALPSSRSVCSILPIAICGPELPHLPGYGAPALLALPFAENGGAWSRRSPFPLLAGIEAHILCEEIPHLG